MNEKYIYFRCGKWSVEIRHKQYGRYNTKEEARKVRDELIEQMKKGDKRMRIKDDGSREYYHSLCTIDRIEDEKIRQGISDTEICRRMGRSFSYWAGIVKKYRITNIKIINEIAKALNIDCRYILEGGERKEYTPIQFKLENISHEMKWKRLYTDNATRVILSRIRNKKQNSISILTYHRLNDMNKGKLFEIIAKKY